MTPDLLFSSANLIAFCGWAVLGLGIVLDSPKMRDQLAGRIVPLVLSVGYLLLIIVFWARAQGGFGSLGDVAALFANPWLLLAGWVHYLAFDLVIGAVIARKTREEGLPRLLLIVFLPLTFLFGPIGFLAFEAVLLIASRPGRNATA